MRPPAKIVVAVALTLTMTALTSCTNKGPDGPTVTVTVPPSSASASATGSAGATSSPTPSSTATALPGTCDATLSDYYVSQALGGAQLAGKDEFVVGVPDSKIGRLSTINCRYGTTGTAGATKAKVEIGVSLYRTAAQASARVTATTSDYSAHGATSKDVTVTPSGQAAVTGSYLSGGSGSGYDLPLLVVAADRRTVAVTVDPAAVSKPPAEQAAVAVAQVALQRTAG